MTLTKLVCGVLHLTMLPLYIVKGIGTALKVMIFLLGSTIAVLILQSMEVLGGLPNFSKKLLVLMQTALLGTLLWPL